MVAAIVARELLISGLRLAAVERGIVIGARDLGKLKTWGQATAAAVGGFAAAGAWEHRVAWWTMVVALALTWISAADYARSVPAHVPRRSAGRSGRTQRCLDSLTRFVGVAERLVVPGPPPGIRRVLVRRREQARQ